jgi:hypothetical protein
MSDDVEVVAGGAGTPHRLMMDPQQPATGTPYIALEGRVFHPRSILVARLTARYRLAIAFAAIYAESMLGGDR